MLTPDTLTHLWLHLGWPLLRLLVFLSLGLLVALFIESLNWTRRLACASSPAWRPTPCSPRGMTRGG
jgi:hypothetical protein